MQVEVTPKQEIEVPKEHVRMETEEKQIENVENENEISNDHNRTPSVIEKDGNSEIDNKTNKSEIELHEMETEWEYQLPSPPNGFRDNSPTSQLLNQINDDFKCDSVVTSPELFEKLKEVQKDDKESTISSCDVNSINNEEIFNKLSLENLEKRKTLVYNRELATSLKFAQSDNNNSIKNNKTVLNELDEMMQQNKTTRTDEKQSIKQTESLLPNFKITTYDNTIKNINIFEDDSIRSNSEAKRGSLDLTNLNYEFKKPEFVKNKPKAKTTTSKYQNDNNVNVTRSGSFSSLKNWSPTNPVKRSKSQVALNKYKDEGTEKEEEVNLKKSNSLFDVSGLQSLEVSISFFFALKANYFICCFVMVCLD